MPDHMCDFADVNNSKSVQGIVRCSTLPAMHRLPGLNFLDHCCCTICRSPLLLLHVTKTSPLLQFRGYGVFFS